MHEMSGKTAGEEGITMYNPRGVMALIESATDKRNDGKLFTLEGDLSQMANQRDFLEKRGFRVGRIDCYPGLFTEEDYRKALTAIWENRVDGWWHYDEDYVKYGICTMEQFNTRLGRK